MKRLKKFFVFISLLLAGLLPCHAQHNVFVCGTDGGVSVFPVSEVDYVSFSFDDLFQISASEAYAVTPKGFQIKVSVALKDGVTAFSAQPEVGVCYTSEALAPTVSHETVKAGEGVGEYVVSLTGLTGNQSYRFRPYVRLSGEVWYGETNVQRLPEEPSGGYKVINGHEFVDLGLPSGLLWATCNVGAESPGAYGDYFAWGETGPKSVYSWETYKWFGEESGKFTKYCLWSSSGQDGFTDGKTALEPADDAATANWGAPCRMPTTEDFEELIKNCHFKPEFIDGVITGWRITSKKNENAIFLPAAGERWGDQQKYAGSEGSYWAASLNKSMNDYANLLYCRELYPSADDTSATRCSGFTVRPVCIPE